MKNIAKYYPYFLALIIAIVFYYFEDKLPNLNEVIKKILDSALVICGALLGFLLTILTLINSINTRRMKFLKEAGYYPMLNNYLKTALYSNLISISIYFILPILSSINHTHNERNLAYALLIYIISFTWIVNVRFSSIFIKLMTDPQGH